MVQFSKHVIKAWGFEPMGPEDAVTATFTYLAFLTIKGLAFTSDTVQTRKGSVDGVEYEMAVGNSLNALVHTLTGHTHCEDEKKWARDKKAGPPYVVLRIGRTRAHTCADGYRMRVEDDAVDVYQCFEDAIEEARALGNRVTGRVASALACSVQGDVHPTEVRRADGCIVGLTDSGALVRVFRPSLFATGHTSVRVAEAEMDAFLESSTELGQRINPKVAKFLWLGMNETDELRRFLYLFLAIEIETKQAFKAATFPKGTKRPTDLHVLFAWCAEHVWHQILKEDVDLFLTLKKARNDVAHGERDAPEGWMLAAMEKLAKKVLRKKGGQ